MFSFLRVVAVFRGLIDQILSCQTGSIPSSALKGVKTIQVPFMSQKYSLVSLFNLFSNGNTFL